MAEDRIFGPYGVFSFPQFYSKSGYWAASGGVQTNKTKESIAEFASVYGVTVAVRSSLPHPTSRPCTA
jgi:hypothetical protein